MLQFKHLLVLGVTLFVVVGVSIRIDAAYAHGCPTGSCNTSLNTWPYSDTLNIAGALVMTMIMAIIVLGYNDLRRNTIAQ